MAKSKHHRSRFLSVIALVISLELLVIGLVASRAGSFALLEPAGTIAAQQKNLILIATGLSLLVIIPVFGLLGFIIWRYRDGNVNATYKPNWDSNKKLEAIWWGLPLIIITILAVITYQTSHSLDPYKPLESKIKPLKIQVVALQWKWLFIYPEENIATVNHLTIPEDTPINFEITADAPMNSFWIPQLGGQVYAMNGMTTKLHLIADEAGHYRGNSANISGEGFADMNFTVTAVPKNQYDAWVKESWQTDEKLTSSRYAQLAKADVPPTPLTFSGRDESLFSSIIHKHENHGVTH